jgi:hypothetical protein
VDIHDAEARGAHTDPPTAAAGLIPSVRVNVDVSSTAPALAHLLLGSDEPGDAESTFLALRRACSWPMATFDSRVRARLRLEHGQAGQMLLAPALLSTERCVSNSIVIFVHDGIASDPDLVAFQSALHQQAPRMDIFVHLNAGCGLDDDISWLLPETRSALCHIHLGTRAPARSQGRLLDSAAAGVPIVIFGSNRASFEPLDASFDAEAGLRPQEHHLAARSFDEVAAHVARLLADPSLGDRLARNAGNWAGEMNRSAARAIMAFLERAAR